MCHCCLMNIVDRYRSSSVRIAYHSNYATTHDGTKMIIVIILPRKCYYIKHLRIRCDEILSRNSGSARIIILIQKSYCLGVFHIGESKQAMLKQIPSPTLGVSNFTNCWVSCFYKFAIENSEFTCPSKPDKIDVGN